MGLAIPDVVNYSSFPLTHFGRLCLENGVSIEKGSTQFQVLSENSLAEFWLINFGNDGRKRKIRDDFWVFSSIRRELACNWDLSLSSSINDSVETCLIKLGGWTDTTPMYFLGGIEIVQVNWGDFVKHWRTFVEFNDEGLLLCDTTDCGLVVSPQGFFYKVSA